ncbi:MAG: 50S ribosomal protein L31, partial [Candidatus Thioglobus sp.]
MRPNIHPKYSQVNISCSCGNKFDINSTLE